MSDLKAQKRLASDVLDVGKNRVWFDPEAQGEIADAITREEIRELVSQGLIQSKEARSNSRGRAREREEKRAYGHQKGAGKRRGKAGARQNEKDQWKDQIRAQRRKLRELRDEGEIDSTQYRELYNKSGGGEFRSIRYMTNYIDSEYGDE
ncbi:50S ribosomal protein L19e [Halalkalicoccus jeotgali]|uniref:Large ribosomal subunit protein eL19 n=1 Tax=Halalkalicoccus jeotgali (strain DSM 18796 / CECT 7217 / JCM 14584 / KCTC 4019 / B3) TaxID=795797 RepID=D8J9K3_HALJB|nr:50S ribosomal protein L19e [Halalkalicoccus jeotgali]ADJ14415.1 50S ribosomal protein L19e [Halalkalicoccus jeotgali B3]ELY40131.1 50S ribosomal protein L19e [Halalkalicoccus jeotgali B3]